MEVDPRWLGPDGYINFYTDLGPAPVGSVLDRRDNTVGYLQGNVRWTSIGKSNENRSNTRFITAFGETRSMAEWADDLGVTATALYQRINVMGWSPEEAVTRPSEQVRPCNEQFFLEIAGRVAKRGTCMRRKVGCVLTDKQNNVLTTAYNATPAGLPHCTDSPCKGAFAKPGENLHSCLAKHAEELALIKCKDIYAIKDCYVTISPCPECVRRLLDTSCQRIIFAEEYADTSAKAIWEKAGRQWVYFLAEDLRPTADLTPLEEAILAKSP
jgi:dCMP deaminase